MPVHVPAPARIEAAGTGGKRIEEFVGRVNTATDEVSIARMRSPEGWSEPPQAPEFDEYTLVLAGLLRVEHAGGALEVRAGEAVLVRAGERVRYSTPGAGGADYVAVCLPAFTPGRVHREA
ncbi:MAG TPA: cupin [Candidatus Eisenbacteria bacterium]|nr:cupin [Candidatus Eisenbacteria bacterium]